MNFFKKTFSKFFEPIQQRRFQAARIDRLSSDWLTTQVSINQELRSDLDKLRARGRELVNNNDYARKFRGMVENNIIGPDGYMLQLRVEDAPNKPDNLANTSIEKAFADWSKVCDVTGQLSFRDLCENLVGGMPSDGEFLVRFVYGKEAQNRFNFALQVIDVDRIDTQFNRGETANHNAVIMGVEVNQFRRPVALHLFAAHPSDGVQSSRQRIRVETTELLHRFKVERAEQLRGIPWMAPSMLSLHHLGGFKLAALLAAEHGANHFGFFTTPDGAPAIGGTDESNENITTSQPGVYDTLPAGVTFTPHESKYPNEVFGPFVKTTLQRIASGWRVAYHSLANDLEGVSFSSIRSGTLEERDRWSADQTWFIGAFLDPVFDAWLKMALLSGAITMPNGSPLPASKIQKFSTHEWQSRRWDWVDPKNDMEAKILSVRAGLIAPQDLSAQMGYDFESTLKKIQTAQQLAKDYGISLTAYEATPGAIQANQAANQEDQGKAKKNAA
jgi:lambda family phage portal protein